MQYLPVTNIFIAVMVRDDRVLGRRLRIHRHEIALSAIVLHELYFGAYGGEARPDDIKRLRTLDLPVLDFEVEDARVAAEIRAALRRRGTPIGPYECFDRGAGARPRPDNRDHQHARVRARGGAESRGLDGRQMIVPGHPRIAVDSAICGGRPTIAGTRMRVTDILEALAAGTSDQEIVQDFPYVNLTDIRACLGYAAALAREK
jgi:uncharacterized protein (DUF433 family)/predicted nucleic acid-binding protein